MEAGAETGAGAGQRSVATNGARTRPGRAGFFTRGGKSCDDYGRWLCAFHSLSASKRRLHSCILFCAAGGRTRAPAGRKTTIMPIPPAPPIPPVPPLQPPPGVSGWSVAGLGKSCSAHCTDMGMLCSYAALQFYNGAVDSSEEVLHLIAIDASAAETSATVCVSHTGTLAPFFRIRRLLVQIAQRQPSRLSVPGCTLQPPKQTVLLHELAFALAATLATTTLATTTLSPSPHGSAAAVLATLPAHSTTLATRSARSARSAACATAITAALYTRRRRSLRPR